MELFDEIIQKAIRRYNNRETGSSSKNEHRMFAYTVDALTDNAGEAKRFIRNLG